MYLLFVPKYNIAFVFEIRIRYLQRMSQNVSNSIKKGGSADSLYFNSSAMTPPEECHKTLAPNDEIGMMSDEYLFFN